MAKITLDDITNIFLAINTINANNAKIETAMENTLSRDGTSPNEMNANLDMNNHRIYNLAAPSSPADAVRLTDVQDIIDGLDDLEQAVEDAQNAASSAAGSAGSASSSAQDAEDAQAAAEQARDEAVAATANKLDLDAGNVVDPTTVRSNLGLGNSATRNVGTTAGTVADGGDLAAKYDKAGGTIDGAVTIDPSSGWAQIILDKPASGTGVLLNAKSAGLDRWNVYIGDATPESGANVGSDFGIARSNDAGVFIDTPLTILRSDGIVRLTAPPIITSARVDQDGNVHLSRVNTFTDGVGNDSPAVQTALDALATAGGGCLILPSGGTVRLDTQINYTADNPITIRSFGGRRGATIDQRVGTALSFVGSGSGSSMAVCLEGIRFLGNFNAATAVGLNGIENIEMSKIRAASGTGYWNSFLYGEGVRTSHFHDWYVRNDHGLGTFADIQGAGVRLTASGVGSTSNVFTGLLLQGFNQAFNFDASGSPGIEGTYINNCEIVQCGYGILWRHSSGGGYYPPLLKYTNGHMNCFRSWGVFELVAQVDISHNTLELNSVFGHTDHGLTFSQVPGITAESNRVYFTNGSRAASAFLLFSQADVADIHNNKFNIAGANNGIEIQSGSNIVDVTNNAFTGTGTGVQNGGGSSYLNNNRVY